MRFINIQHFEFKLNYYKENFEMWDSVSKHEDCEIELAFQNSMLQNRKYYFILNKINEIKFVILKDVMSMFKNLSFEESEGVFCSLATIYFDMIDSQYNENLELIIRKDFLRYYFNKIFKDFKREKNFKRFLVKKFLLF
jgi:hypothetical protein